MAKALRSDLVNSQRWAVLVRLAHNRLDAFVPEKCPKCEVQYTLLLGVIDDVEDVVKLLSKQLSRECPEHQSELYSINEGPYGGRIVAQRSN
jgi:hypothetical protein